MTEKFNTSDVQSMIGIKITAEYIVDTLGIEPFERDKRALFWSRDQVAEIAQGIRNRMLELAEDIRSGSVTPAKAEKKPKKAEPAPAKTAAELFDEDDDEL